MPELVHLAGDAITFDNRMRQRCLWCGALIEDRDWSRIGVAIRPGQTAEQAAAEARSFRWNGWVAVDGGARWAVEEEEPGKAPENSCLRMDPAVTS